MSNVRSRLANVALHASRSISDVVYPRRCAGCGHRGAWVCTLCVDTVPMIREIACWRCGVPPDVDCLCREIHPGLDMIRTAAWFEGWLRSAVTSFKYEGEKARAGHLAALAQHHMPAFGADVCLTAVPLHRSRERRRGYNQSALLASQLSQMSGVANERCLRRVVATRRQVGLSADERTINVRGAFALEPLATALGRRFVLVDDVFTTGSTLGECAETLKRAGAVWVGALTIARER